MFLTYSNDTAGTSARYIAMCADRYADAIVPERAGVSIVLSPGNPSGFDTVVNSPGLVTAGNSSAPRDGREASTAGRHLDRGAIPAAGQQAVLLPRHIDQFHEQEIAAYANQPDGYQDNQDGKGRQGLLASTIGRFGRSRPAADLIVHPRYSLPGIRIVPVEPEVRRQPSSACLTVTLRRSTEPRIDACEAQQGRITRFAFPHRLRIAACDFHVGLRGSLDEFLFVEYVRDSDFPLFVGSIHESRERTQNRKNYPVRYFRGFAIFSREQGESCSPETRMRLPSFVDFPGLSGDIEKVLVNIRTLALFTRSVDKTLKQL